VRAKKQTASQMKKTSSSQIKSWAWCSWYSLWYRRSVSVIISSYPSILSHPSKPYHVNLYIKSWKNLNFFSNHVKIPMKKNMFSLIITFNEITLSNKYVRKEIIMSIMFFNLMSGQMILTDCMNYWNYFCYLFKWFKIECFCILNKIICYRIMQYYVFSFSHLDLITTLKTECKYVFI